VCGLGYLASLRANVSTVRVAFWVFLHVRMAIRQVSTNISLSSVCVKLSTAVLIVCWLLMYKPPLLAKNNWRVH